MVALLLVIVVIAAGVVVAVRSAQSPRGQDASGAERNPTPGLWSLVSGIVAAVGVAMVGQATFGWMTAFDPPEWLRILTFWMLPAGVASATIFGALSLTRNSGRALGIVGLLLALLSVLGFIAMVAAVG